MTVKVKTPDLHLEVLNALKEPLFILDSEGKCLFANRALLSLLGYSDDLLDFKTLALFADCSSPVGVYQNSHQFVGCNGDRFIVKLDRQSLEDGKSLFRVVSSLSQTNPINSFHSQRLETLGLLAGGVAHDFNNILMGVLGHTTYLKTVLPKQGPHIESLTAIEDGTRRGSAITQQKLKSCVF